MYYTNSRNVVDGLVVFASYCSRLACLINSSRLSGESLFQQPSADKMGKPSCSITKDADTEAYKAARYAVVS